MINELRKAKDSRPVGRVLRMAIACLCLGVVVADSGRATASDRPNLLLIVTDDQRWDALGCMGNPIVQTPHVDRLAQEGTLFTNAFCTTSICSISRASILAGQYARRHQIIDFSTMFTPEAFAQTFPARLREHGYRVGFIGKWGVGRDMPKDEYDFWGGFPGQGRYFDPNRETHMTRHLGDLALEFLNGCETDQPFCLQLSLKAAHCQDGEPWPFQPDPKYHDFYLNDRIPTPPTASEGAFAKLPEALQVSEARNRWYVRFANQALFQKSVKDYYRLLTGADEIVGELREKLRQRGFDDNTVIVYTSDNGFYLSEHGFAGKWFAHEESIRLPLVVYDPRLPETLRGQTRDEMALNIDFAPTLLDYAGIEIPKPMQGESLRPLVEGNPVPWRDDFLYEHSLDHPRIPKSEGVRNQRYKYVQYLVEPVREQLFDLENDPREVDDLSQNPEHQQLLANLRLRLRALRESAR